MSNSKIKIVAEMAKSSAQLKDSFERSGLRYEQVNLLSDLLRGLLGGNESAILSVEVGDAAGDGTAASGVVTIAGSGAQSVTINGQAMTGGTDYEIANLSAAEVASNLADAIALSSSSKVQAVMAELSGSTVILKSKSGGAVGNLVTLSASGDASASVANLEGGADDGQDVYKFNVKS